MGGCVDHMHFGSPEVRASQPGSPSKADALPGYGGVLCARLPQAAAPAESLSLPDPLDASTWTVHYGGSLGALPIFLVCSTLAKSFEPAPPGATGPLERVFVQFRMDNLGRHEYVCLGEVQLQAENGSKGGRLKVVTEDEVKALKRQFEGTVTIINAAPPEQYPVRRGPSTHVSPQDLDLCPPKGFSRNYNVVEDLSLGPTQRVMLSDENTLQIGVHRNGIKIFNYLTLIVNCHETESQRTGRYNVGSATPKVLYRPIHFLMRDAKERRIEVMDEIQQEIWRCLQEGSVAVHCLAGVHRAPTVVVCHYLYRHYVLGHKQVETDVDEIYRRLRAIRGRQVDALGYRGPIIDTYKEYLVQRAAARQAAATQPPPKQAKSW